MNSSDEFSNGEFVAAYKVETCLFTFIVFLLGRMAWKLIHLVPQFQSIFESMNIELPVATRFLLRLSSLCNRYWIIVFPFAVAAIIHIIWSLCAWLNRRGSGPKGEDFRAYTHLYFLGAILFLLVIESLAQLAFYEPMLNLVSNVD